VAKHPNDFHLAALPVISVAVTAGYLSLVGEVQHCVQVRDARACEVLFVAPLDSTPENPPINPMQGKPQIVAATTSSTTAVVSEFKVFRI
jgi:hypothetical protein